MHRASEPRRLELFRRLNLAPNGTPTDVFTGLDIAASVMYKDGGVGDRPVFAPMQADVMRVRDDLPVWTQLHNFS